MRIPQSTYRFQFNSQFRFADAVALIPYLRRLGVSDLYASPIFKARPGSTHGYDVTDPTVLNPELGTEADFGALCDGLKSGGMGLLLDVVPNHMAVSLDNPWWLDLLENGRRSRYARYFDVDWNPVSGISENKIVVPILRTTYAEALEGRKMNLVLDTRGFWLDYYGMRLPLELATTAPIITHRLHDLERSNPRSHRSLTELLEVMKGYQGAQSYADNDPGAVNVQRELIRAKLWELYSQDAGVKQFLDANIGMANGQKGDPRSFDLLDHLLNHQWYRLTFWRTALENINYRRFFNISDLISVRTEDPAVFSANHELIFRLLAEGRVTGLRIDHIDGLYNPAEYLVRLQSACTEPKTGDGKRGAGQAGYVVIEKILSGEEPLREGWATSGTTGYEFLNLLNGIFVDPDGLEQLNKIYADFTGQQSDFRNVHYESKRLVMGRKFSSELQTLEHQLNRLANQDRYGRDVSRRELERGFFEVIACLPVYRTYTASYEVAEEDRVILERTFAEVRRRNPTLSAPALRFLQKLFKLEFASGTRETDKQEWLGFVMRWQQFTGPIAAKGVEDTALYLYHRLISLNEVGGEPGAGAVFLADFHRYNETRQQHWPGSLSATSTHDTKRGEDARARINVLSELAETWGRRQSQWSRWNSEHRTQIPSGWLPDRNQETLIYQTLLGSWPLSNPASDALGDRLTGFIEKAMREAQTYSNWRRPNETNEKAVKRFVSKILEPGPDNHFLADFQEFASEIAFFGAINSLAQVVVKLAAPGVPDIYQGSELWNLAMVDPDNRRPVDFGARDRLLTEIEEGLRDDPGGLADQLASDWKSGAVKMLTTVQGLRLRLKERDVFARGQYLPLDSSGERRDFVYAFARRHDDAWVVAAVPRLVTRLVHSGQFPIGKDVWGDTVLVCPAEAPDTWTDELTGQALRARKAGDSLVIDAGSVFARLPVALLRSGRPAETDAGG